MLLNGENLIKNYEKVAYIKKVKNDHIDYSVTNSGLVINQNFLCMWVSPDGIINWNYRGKSCFEINKRPHSLIKKLENRKYVIFINWKLNKSHQYCYQLQA